VIVEITYVVAIVTVVHGLVNASVKSIVDDDPYYLVTVILKLMLLIIETSAVLIVKTLDVLLNVK
jgi:hypothetical protein